MQQNRGGSKTGGRVRLPDPRLAARGGVRHRAGHPGRELRPQRRRHPPHHQRGQRAGPPSHSGERV